MVVMRKFKFRLQTPLKVKLIKEKMARQEFLRALVVKQGEEDVLRLLNQKYSDTKKTLGELNQGYVNIGHLMDFDIYSNALRGKIKDQREAVKRSEIVCDSTRSGYIEAKKEKQVLEKIREKRHHKHVKSINREEQKLSDEIAENLFSRKDGDFEQFI
jgi:flagellar FliJ protein